jgi:malate dehydrogenase (oxaloacetate-decarboxylating)(NADP+)
MIKKEDSLKYHSIDRRGKIEIHPTKACLTPREMRLCYLPGASFPSCEIIRDISNVYKYTAKGNLVGVITDGSAVPGLGNVGPLAAKPMQEGIASLFKRLADIDVFDLELDTRDTEQFIETVKVLEPTFGGINLKDIKAPEGLKIYEMLCSSLNIPVYHENLYSTAVVAVAALINALDLTEKRLDAIRVVLLGAGTVGIGCARLLTRLGINPENLLVYDIKGLLHPDREDLSDYQRPFAVRNQAHKLEKGFEGSDVFIGASTGGILKPDMIRLMNKFPIVFALATPEPEIDYKSAKESRKDVIVATSSARYPNSILDLLSFPYIFRGALDIQAAHITENMLLAAAHALADLARDEVVEEVERAYGFEHFSFGPEYLLPKPIDPRILVRESTAVALQAIKDNVAKSKIKTEDYQESLTVRLGTGRETMRRLILRARQENFRVVFSEGMSDTILRSCSVLLEEGIAKPILLGPEDEIKKKIDKLDLELSGIEIIDPNYSLRFDAYVDEYFHRRHRRGVIRATAVDRMRHRDYYAAMMVHSGDADIMIGGFSTHYVDTLRTLMEVIGPEKGVKRISSFYLVLLPKDVVLLADCAVNINPTAEELAEIALLTARTSRALGIEPVVAMLSFSNFGSVDSPSVVKVRNAAEIVKQKYPDLIIDGEMQLAAARDENIRRDYFPFTRLKSDANILIFPDLQAANLTLQSLQYMGEAVTVGPVLLGTRMPVHLLQYGATVEEVVSLTAVAVVEAAELKKNRQIS